MGSFYLKGLLWKPSEKIKDFSQFPIQRLWDGSCKRVNEIPAIPDSWHVILSLKTIHRLSTHYVKRTGLPKVSTWQKWPWGWLMKSHCQHASRLWNNKTLFILLLFFLRFLWMWTIFFKSFLNLLQYSFCVMFWFFWLLGILASWLGIQPAPPALEGKVLLNQWTTREVAKP